MRIFKYIAIVMAFASLLQVNAATVMAQSDKPNAGPNLPFPTLGGKQIWADNFIYAGWRIQQNVYTDHFRLLDDRDIRRAWGDEAACREAKMRMAPTFFYLLLPTGYPSISISQSISIANTKRSK